jgi:hypothetical protein
MTPERKEQLIEYYQTLLNNATKEQDIYYFAEMLEFMKNSTKPNFDSEGRQRKPQVVKAVSSKTKEERSRYHNPPQQVYCGANEITYKSIGKAAKALGISHFVLLRYINGHKENKFKLSFV